MKTFHRIVKVPVHIEDGDRVFDIKVGDNVLTSDVRDVEGVPTVTVFKSCWVPVPVAHFDGARSDTEEETIRVLSPLTLQQAAIAAECGLWAEIVHCPGKLSHFSLRDPVHGEFDSECYNNEPLVVPYYFAALFQRFTTERFRRWKRIMSATTL